MKTLALIITLFLFTPAFAEDIDLIWDANTETDLDHYTIYRAELVNYDPPTKSWQFSTWVEIAQVPAGTQTYTDIGFPDDKIPLYVITATNAVGIESKISNGAMLTFQGPASVKGLLAE